MATIEELQRMKSNISRFGGSTLRTCIEDSEKNYDENEKKLNEPT